MTDENQDMRVVIRLNVDANKPDKHAIELEKSIFNWYYDQDDPNVNMRAVMNTLYLGLKNDMQVIVPIETPPEMVQAMGDPSKIPDNHSFTVPEQFGFNFRHLHQNIDGQLSHEYLLPVFTSVEALEKGVISSAMTKPLSWFLECVNKNLWPDCYGLVINPWTQPVTLSREWIQSILVYQPQSFMSFIKGSVVDMHVDAIVNAANKTLLGGGGVDGAIHRAAGPELHKECKTLHGCEVGMAKITGAYNISWADYIIHTVGPIYAESTSPEDSILLETCYRNCLDLALENGCTSIAFPCISTGAYGFPIDRATLISLTTVAKWLDTHPEVIMNVYFCCFRDVELEAYKVWLRKFGR